jgi:tetratricopeptide (TPR) repeat protein
MAEYDLFELTNLSFDPPEKAAKKVRLAIEKARKDLGAALGSATQQLERDDINGKLAFLGEKEANIFTQDDRLNEVYEKLAKKRVENEIEKLKKMVNIYKSAGRLVVTNGTIRTQRQKTRLSKENVEAVYTSAGFTIKEINPLSAMPKFPENADKIYNELAALRKSKDPNPNGADLTKAVDMYAFVAYLKKEPENAIEYRSKTTGELARILGEFSQEYSTRNDPLGKLWQSLAATGKTNIFNSDDSRRAYELYLLYKSPELTELFETFKLLSGSDLRDSKYADHCIKQITNVFGDGDMALAIYNNAAGLKDDPYIPDKAAFYVKCAHCQIISEFEDIADAQKINKCSQCGKPLYQQCRNCKKKVLASADKCPECGFVFASVELFSKYINLAEEALRRGDLEEARRHLASAKSYDPGEKTRTADLSKRIDAAEALYEKPINELRQLIAKKNFRTASEALTRIIASFPKLNVSSYETQINAALSKAQSLFDDAKKKSPSTCADICIGLLEDCCDYKPAVEFLRTTAPDTCRNLSVGIDSNSCSAAINWTRSGGRGITYRIVRKTGKVAPKNEKDGDTIADNITENVYKDENLTPGAWYSYSVFAKRMEVCSPAVSGSVLLVADVTNVRHEQIDTTIRITWNLPKNCSGVKITCANVGKEVVLTENAQSSFEDKGIEYNKSYSYTLKANYFGLPSSDGVGFTVRPSIKIDKFTMSASQINDNKYKVTWDIKPKDIDLRILVNNNVVRELKSDKTGTEIELPVNGFHVIEVSAFSGGNWLKSQNNVQINSYNSCKIDEKQSQLTEKIVFRDNINYKIELSIRIDGTIPGNVLEFRYFVRIKPSASASAPWANAGELATAQDINKISVDSYKKRNEIFYSITARDEDAYYLTLFTVYNVNGKEIVSSPTKKKFTRPLIADILWKVSKPLIGNGRLSVEIKPNKPLTRSPGLILCAGLQGQHLLSYTDTNATVLMKVDEQEFKTLKTTYIKDYEINSAILSRLNRNSKLFLFEESSFQNEKYTPRHANGFSGKV